MTFFTKIATTALAALSALSIPVTALADNNFQDHAHLVDAIQSVGVRYYVNPDQCYKGRTKGADGFYVSQAGVLVVCQDNATGNEQVQWTDNDLDTLRHEAIHLIQDCKDGRGDNSLQPIIETKLKRTAMAMEVLGHKLVRRIVIDYAKKGASSEIIFLELEAFTFARAVGALTISEAVISACGVKK